jgi:anti-sigma factor RsiW
VSILEHGLGLLPPDRAEELARHLATCAGCRELVAEEAQLSARLSSLASVEPPTIDVRARVVDEIRTLAPGRELSPVGWGAAAALLALVSFLGWSVAAWPTIAAGVREARAATQALAVVTSAVLGSLAPLGVWLLDLAHTAARALGTLAPLARAAAPFVATLLVASALVALATIAYAVTRDLVRPLVSVEDP